MRSALFGPCGESAWTGPSSSGSSPGRDAHRVHPALQRAPATSGPRPRGAGAGAHHRCVAPRRHRSPQRARRTHPRVPPVGRVVRAPACGGSWTQGEGRGHAPMTTQGVRQRGAAHHQYWLTSQRAPLRGLGNSPDQTPASHAECLQRDRGIGALQLRVGVLALSARSNRSSFASVVDPTTNVPVTRASFSGSVGDPWSGLPGVLGKGLVQGSGTRSSSA